MFSPPALGLSSREASHCADVRVQTLPILGDYQAVKNARTWPTRSLRAAARTKRRFASCIRIFRRNRKADHLTRLLVEFVEEPAGVPAVAAGAAPVSAYRSSEPARVPEIGLGLLSNCHKPSIRIVPVACLRSFVPVAAVSVNSNGKLGGALMS
jgi:hypothetical protein